MAGKNVKKDENAYELYRQIPLFSDLPESSLHKLFNVTKEIEFKAGEYVIHEGEVATDFFVILDGTLEVIKYDAEHKNVYKISTLSKGQTIGEMAWLNDAPRSASVRAMTTTRLLRTSLDDIQEIADTEPKLYRVFKQISKNLSQRLHTSDEFAIRALERELQENKIRVALGNFMVNIIAALCFFSFALTIMIKVTKEISSTTFLSVLFLFLMLIFLLLVKKSSGLPLKIFGITTENWRISVYEAVIFTIPAILLATAIKWGILHFKPDFAGAKLFSPYNSIHTLHDPFKVWLISLFLYCFLSVPFQEALARGGLQAPLMVFLTGKYKLPFSILVSNLIFSTMHLYLSLYIAILVFIPGLYFGWLFGRHKNLIGVYIAHVMLGSYALFFLGI